MDFTTMSLHDLQAEKNARLQLLGQSQAAAIAHLEHVVGAILLAIDTTTLGNIKTELASIETLDATTEGVVQLFGETTTDTSVKSQREQWRVDLDAIEAQIATLEAQGQTDEA